MLNSGIEYIDHSWNPWVGCRKVSDGCLNCYMHREMARFGKDPANIHRTSRGTWNQAKKFKPGSTVFVCTWSDFFIEEADPWRDDAWAVIGSRPLVKWLIVTKRPERINGRLPWGRNPPWPNVVGIVTAENQEMANLRIPILLRENFAIRGVSVEPMLDEIDLERGGWSYLRPLIPLPGNKGGGWNLGIDWVICGTESGPNRRPAKTEWIRSLRDQCAEISFFMKQMETDGKLVKAPMLDGRQWTERPW